MLDRASILPIRLGLAAGFGLLLSSGPLFPQTAVRNDAFPLEIGNSWTYAGTVWWTPSNSFRILKEQIDWEIEVVDVIERPGVRAAVLRGLPNDLVVLGRGRAPAEYMLVQIGEDKLYLLSGARIGEALRALRDPRGRPPTDLVRDSELVLDLPLFQGKTFCSTGVSSDSRLDRACWSVREQSSIDLAAVGGLSGTGLRQRYTLDLHWGGDHIVWGFVPGVGLTSYAIGHNGVVSAAELDLVEANLSEPDAAPLRQALVLKEQDEPDERQDEPDERDEPGEPDGVAPQSTSVLESMETSVAGGGTAADGSPAMREEPPEPEPPSDADGDGVVDPLDACSDTAAGAPVNPSGCPLPQDADEDGVVDPADACPDTAAGVAVNESGCPVPRDSDGDGVVDPRDVCPHTPPGRAVNDSGCPLPRDSDGDRVVDPRDACPDTAPGASVDPFGCPPPPIVSTPAEPAEVAMASEGPEEKPAIAMEMPAPADPVPADPAPADPAPADPASAAPGPTGTPEVAPCLDDRDWFQEGTPIEFDGRRFEPGGEPEPISLENLIVVGDHDGVPLFVGGLAAEPYPDLWLPLCHPAGSYQLYAEVDRAD